MGYLTHDIFQDAHEIFQVITSTLAYEEGIVSCVNIYQINNI